MKLPVKAGGKLQMQHSAMNAAAVAAVAKKSEGIKLTFPDTAFFRGEERTIPPSPQNPLGLKVNVISAVGVLIEDNAQPKTINVSRILGQLTTGSDLDECVDSFNAQMTDADSNTLLVDVETLSDYGNAQRFSNIRIAK